MLEWQFPHLRLTDGGWATSVMRWIAALPLLEVTCTSLGGKRASWQKRETLLGKSTPFSAPNG